MSERLEDAIFSPVLVAGKTSGQMVSFSLFCSLIRVTGRKGEEGTGRGPQEAGRGRQEEEGSHKHDSAVLWPPAEGE